ncbi:MAG: ATPase [bacterium]|nr:ATPase [bacterium]
MAKEEAAQTPKKSERSDLAVGLLALAAALSVGTTAIATGIAQSKIGAAGAGAIVEKPELSGTIIVLIAIPETMVILGFVVAAIIIYAL